MSSFFELAGYELKKILTRKGTLIALAISALIAVLSPAEAIIGYAYVDGVPFESHYEGMVKDRAYAQALGGRMLDGKLFREMKAAYEKVPEVESAFGTAEYQEYARPYNAVFVLLTNVYRDINTGNFRTELTDEKMDGYYEARLERITKLTDELKASESTKEKLKENAKNIETPFTFQYTEGYNSFLSIMYTTGIVTAFIIAICLAPMFSGEYATGASQLILSSRYGKGKIIGAKIFTGMAFSMGLFLLNTLVTVLMCGVLFGFEGGGSPLELIPRYPGLPYGLTFLQMAGICSVCSTLAGVLTGAFTMLLSSRFKSPFGVIIIMSVVTVLPMMLSISSNNMFLFNLYQLLPSNMMYPWSGVYYPYEFFGFGIPPYVFLPLFSVCASAVILPFAWKSFKKHQQD